MNRWVFVVAALAACGGPKQRPSRLFADGHGRCPDPKGCSAIVDSEQHFALPDDTRPAPPDGTGNLGPAENREATCADVGEAMASFELGNYADEDARNPVIDKYAASCKKTKLVKDERQCIFESADKPTAVWCVPRMFPKEPPTPVVDAKSCDALTAQMKAQMTAAGQASEQALGPRQLAAVVESCKQDRWTIAFGECLRYVQLPSYIPMYCSPSAPAPLRKKIEDRLAAIK